MSTVQAEVYGAFRSLDIADDKALRAAAVLSRQGDDLAELRADMRDGFAAVRAEAAKGFARVDAGPAVVKGEQVVVRWMLGFVLAMQVAILFEPFTH